MDILQETMNDIKANNITSAVVAVGSPLMDNMPSRSINSRTSLPKPSMMTGISLPVSLMIWSYCSRMVHGSSAIPTTTGVDYWRYCRKPVFTDASKTFETVSKRFGYGYTLHDVQ